MTLWPVETFDLEIPRPFPDTVKALSDYVNGVNLGESLQYRPLYGTVSADSFVLSARSYAGRVPYFKYFGKVTPNGATTRVRMTLRAPAFPWSLTIAVIAGLFCAGWLWYRARDYVPTTLLSAVALVPAFLVYLTYLIYFYANRTRLRDLTHVMTYYGTRAELTSID